ncbi:MAG: DUF3800 domain-containing protein [Armatimonadetes bacterium]|nr:DUF3800 domain-containing protein [Armatimonadota bacterium]
MYLMYVDESGDCGLTNSPSQYFVLTGLVVHESAWLKSLDELVQFRQFLKGAYGLGVRDEIHASRFVVRPGEHLADIPKHDRLAILGAFANRLGHMVQFSMITVIVDKQGKPATYDVFDNAWRALLQRFENTIHYGNFPGPNHADETGMVFPDHTNDKGLTTLLRRMRRWNPVPNTVGFGGGYRNLRLQLVIEDPSFRDSGHSYFIQAANLAAYLVYQSLAPNSYMRKKGGSAYYQRLQPIFCKVASTRHPLGFVQL